MKWIQKHKKIVFMILLFFLLMGFVCFLLYKPMIKTLQDLQTLKISFLQYGWLGKMILISIMSLQVIFVFLPGEIIEVAAGVLYGPWEGLLLCLIGCFCGSIFVYAIVKYFGLQLAQKVIKKDTWKEIKCLHNQECLFICLFIIYLIPGTPKDILTYFLPLTTIKLSSFLWITTIARIPSIITSTISGNLLGLKQYEFCVLIFLGSVVISILGLFFYKKWIKKKNVSIELQKTRKP